MLLRRYHDGPTKDDRAEPEPEQPPEQVEPEQVERPAKAAPKAEWVAYAVAQGAAQEDAEQATKEQLIERYGG